MKKTILALMLLAPAGALAQGYGTAGCGLGSLVFGPGSGFVQVFAATTNGTFYSQTFGITSGTSNCGKSLFALQGTKVFIEGNREALAKDSARGSGDTIVALRNIASCSAPSEELGSALQRSFGTLFPSATAPAEQVRDNLIRFLQTEKALGCNIG
jgi:hypothetical protein